MTGLAVTPPALDTEAESAQLIRLRPGVVVAEPGLVPPIRQGQRDPEPLHPRSPTAARRLDLASLRHDSAARTARSTVRAAAAGSTTRTSRIRRRNR